jgi:Molybdate transporter of MFS superfamily
VETTEARGASRPGLRFDRNEFAGAFGDLGTDFPLIAGLILVADLDATSVLIMFGAMQLISGLVYRIPMPVQPLKAMAALVIAQGLSGDVLYGAGLAIGATMLLLASTGLLERIARLVPRAVVRGLQFGLGLQLGLLALQEYVPADGRGGYVLAAVGFVIVLVLAGNRRYPAALVVVMMGIAYALVFKLDAAGLGDGLGISLPDLHVPSWSDIGRGFLLLAIPQIPLSLGNSLLATHQLANDLFPQRKISVTKIGLTYSAMNLVNPFFGGVPTCHGSGGLAGHYYFGARTGGSVVIEGAIYVGLGLIAGAGFAHVVELFPLPILGVILAFEALALLRLISDVAGDAHALAITLIVGLIAAGLPYGYAIGLVVGCLLHYGRKWLSPTPRPSRP